MNFKDLLNLTFGKISLNEAPIQAGAAEQKERAKASTADAKARDAARKRVERSKETPRERKPKQELVKDVLVVKTKSGKVQLIFKDSFNASIHEKLNKDVLTVEEAQRATRDENFEQTRASKLLFGNVKGGAPSKGEERKKNASERSEREEARPKTAEEREREEKGKAKKLSKQQMLQAMTQMSPEQLVSMPPELRNEFFKMVRKPPANSDFDRVTFEGLSVEYGLSDTSTAPYNQQVLNALVFLAKLKTGASEQEMQTYLALAPDAREFTRSAFFTARKILSQIGDQCLQNLLSNVETTGKPVNAEGASDMECGQYKFKVAAGGEVSFSTNEFDQSNKNFKGYVATALSQALNNPQLIMQDPKLKASFEKMQQGKEQFSKILVPDELVSSIQQDSKLLKKLQGTEIKGPDGKSLGTVFDAEGNLNPLASASNYQKAWEEGAKEIMGGSAKSNLKTAVIQNVLKTVLRGDNITDPEKAPNHLITVNGIFPMTDEYFNTVSKDSMLDVKKAKDVMTSSNISSYRPSSAAMLKSFTAMVEAVEEKEQSVEKMLINRDDIDPIQFMVSHIVKNNDFLLNASLLPGFNVKDLNSVQYNYVTIGKKTVKIPVIKGENITNQVLGEENIFLNDVLVEALSNNFVLSKLLKNDLLTDGEGDMILQSRDMLNEDTESFQINLQAIYNNICARAKQYPELLENLISDFVHEEYERDYKKEYKNYHGKPKQRKERAARTAARELMIKKGRAKKGDGKDIDHKKALRHGGSNGINNLRVRNKSENRSDNGHKKGEKQNKDWE